MSILSSQREQVFRKDRDYSWCESRHSGWRASRHHQAERCGQIHLFRLIGGKYRLSGRITFRDQEIQNRRLRFNASAWPEVFR